MNRLIRLIAVFSTSACMAQGILAQAITGKGFLPDENGTNLDDPQAGKVAAKAKIAPGTTIKDCGECPEMVVVPSGSFLMGSPPDPVPDPFSNQKPKPIGEPKEKPQHIVQIQSFAIGKTEVTQEQWFAIMGNNQSSNKGRSLPADNISWEDTQEFIKKLNQKTGLSYRLPSEAEWEYAARATATSFFPWGDSEDAYEAYAWFNQNKTNPVGLKNPNKFGLFDMLGNVYEWTQDCSHGNYVGAPTDGSAWTKGNCDVRSLRGGSWIYEPRTLAYRYFQRTSARGSGLKDKFTLDKLGVGFDFGFRLARDL